MCRFFIIAVLILMFSDGSDAQTIFWTETFNNGCTSGCITFSGTAGNGAWTFTNNGTNGAAANRWYISCAENGMAPGACGAGCGANATMHIGNFPNSDCGCFFCPGGDCGAAYDACDGLTFCGGSPLTNKRTISPLISTVGRSGISVSFDYIEGGQGTNDDCIAYYSTNAGSTWSLLVNPGKTATGCGGQGIWANFTSTALPAACDNNANFRLSFVWINNIDGAGSDPSFAVNDLRVRYTTVLPIELSQFSAKQSGSSVLLEWTSLSEKNFSYYEVPRSADALNYKPVGKVSANGNSSKRHDYAFTDSEPAHAITYYRLKMVDLDASYRFSDIVLVDENNPLITNNDYFINALNQLIVQANFVRENRITNADICDMSGKKVAAFDLGEHSADSAALVSFDFLPEGVYVCRLSGINSVKTFRFVISH